MQAFPIIAATAARPLATDDAGVIAAGDCDVEASRLLIRSSADREGETGVALACGVGIGSQLGLGHCQARGPEGRAHGTTLSAKAGVWQGQGQGEQAAALAVSGALGWRRSAGQDWQRQSSEVRLIANLPFRYAFLHVNLGHARSHIGVPKSTTWALAPEHQPASLAGLGRAPLAEVYGDDRCDRWVNVGVRTTVPPGGLFVDLAHARQQAPYEAHAWNAGLRLAF